MKTIREDQRVALVAQQAERVQLLRYLGGALAEYELAKARAMLMLYIEAQRPHAELMLGEAHEQWRQRQALWLPKLETANREGQLLGETALRDAGIDPDAPGTDYQIDHQTGAILRLESGAWVPIMEQ